MNQSAIEIVKPEPVTPMRLLEIAASQNADIDKLHKLMELQMLWEANEARKAFTVAMMTFKKSPPQINKNQHVKIQPQNGRPYEYDHATLDHACDMIIPALAAVGISHGWKVNQSEQIAVTCVLTHELGHKDETTLRASADTSGGKNSIQAISSTVTYLQRYSLLSAVGMAPKGIDKDGKLPASEPESNKLADHLAVAALDDIDACDTLIELQRIFGSRYKMGIEAGDKDFVAQLIKAKDARKEAIRATR